MKIRTLGTMLCASLLFTVAACGAKKTSDSDSSSKADEDSSSKKKDKAPKQAAVEVVLPPVEVKDPGKAQLGGKDVKAELCKMDKAGGDMHDEWFHKALRDAALAPDGSLYVLDHEVKVRKYKNQKEGGCELALDKSFGKDGILDLGYAKDSGADQISIDKSGALYVNGSPAKKIVDGKATDFGCGVVAGAQSATLMDGTKVVKDDKCTGDNLDFKGWDKDSWPKPLTVLGDGFLVSGSKKEGDKNVIKVAWHGADGAQKTIVGKAEGDEDICFAHGAAIIGGNLAVVDGNCKALRVWKPDGSFVGKIDLYNLVGFSIMPRIVEAGKDEVFIIGSGDGKGDDKEDHGVVVRLTGL
ncbi:MAG TPA: hypothetical protein VL400_16050 [Polyangiaceae bacterium]|nr:hypothetical protein [Polyangiaceae bacterium]